MSAIPQKATGEIHIRGGVRLQGKVKIQGSKNAALPILAATILAEGESCLKDCPKISDVYRMLRLLQSLGGHVRWEGEGVCVSTGSITTQDMPADAITGMRSSLCLLGALLARCGSIVMEYPGGCVIGKRPIDLHLQALEQSGEWLFSLLAARLENLFTITLAQKTQRYVYWQIWLLFGCPNILPER